MFAELYDEFNTVASGIRENIDIFRSTPQNTTQYAALKNEIDDGLKNGQELIKQLEIEVYSCDKGEKLECQGKVSRCKDTLTNLKSDYNGIAFGKQRAELMNSAGGKDKVRTVDSTERVSKHSEIIERARQTVDETVEVGNAITEQLKENRERIEHATDNAREISGHMDKAKTDLKRMDRRRWTLGLF